MVRGAGADEHSVDRWSTQQPCLCDLGRCPVECSGDVAERLEDVPGALGELRVAERVRAREAPGVGGPLLLAVGLSAEKTSRERAPRHHAQPHLLGGADVLALDVARHE